MPDYKCRWDRIYLPVKRGNTGKPQYKPKSVQMFNGMFPGYIDPQESGWTEIPVLSEFNQHECCWLEMPRDWKKIAVDCCKHIDEPTEADPTYKDTYRMGSLYFKPEDLQPYAEGQCPDFLNKFYKPGVSIRPIAMPLLPKNLARNASEIDINSVITDVGAPAPGNYTVGPVGATWPTYNGAAGAIAAINVAPAMTGDITVTLTGNITEVANTPLNQTLGGFTLLFTSNTPHYGDPTAGWVISCNMLNFLFYLQEEGPGLFECEHLHGRWISANGANNRFFYTLSILVAHTIRIHDWLMDGNGNRGELGIRCSDNTPTIHWYNTVCWDCDAGTYISTASNANNVIENVAAYNGRVYGFYLNNQVDTLRNCTAYDNATDYVLIGNATGRHNVSSDATAADANWAGAAGVNNTINAVVANDVQGVNDAVANFFDITAGGALDGSGEANAIAARLTCIRNRAVPGPNGTSRGPAEIVTPEPTPVTGRNPATTQSHIATSPGLGLR